MALHAQDQFESLFCLIIQTLVENAWQIAEGGMAEQAEGAQDVPLDSVHVDVLIRAQKKVSIGALYWFDRFSDQGRGEKHHNGADFRKE